MRKLPYAAALVALLAATAFCDEPPPRAPKYTGPVCEPISECGFWLGCAKLAYLEGTTSPEKFRVLGGEHKDQVFARRHSCSPAVGAGETCLEYCSGSKETVCVDGLSVDAAKCEETARPMRATFQCALRADGECVKSE